MATRFYLPSTGAAAVSPAFLTWDSTASAVRRKCVTTKISSAMANNSATTPALFSPEYTLLLQYVSDPIAAQTISGSLKGQIRASESAVAANSNIAVAAQVVSNDGATQRGILFAHTSAENSATTPPELAAALTNRRFLNTAGTTPITLTNVTAQTNDRIVIEIGFSDTTAIGGETINLNFGDNSGTDLAENDTDTVANNPWIEFSQTITFPTGLFPPFKPLERTRIRM